MTDAATSRRPRLLAVASHPIQYHAPLFRALAASGEVDLTVLFIEMPDAHEQGRGFGIAFEWDVPLLEGYRWGLAAGVKKRAAAGFFARQLNAPRALLRHHAPDAVLLTGWHTWPLVQLALAAKALGLPVMMRAEANALRRRPWPVRLAHRMLLGCCRTFLPIGRASRDFYLGYGIAPLRLFDAPYFVDNARFAHAAAEAEANRTQWRERWAIPRDAVCFCYAGKLEPKKRILDVLAALAVATRSTRVPLHLLVVGTGELMAAARAFASAQSLPVTFAGFLNQSEIPAAYAASDCLVLASDFGETWGLVVNEAMACGRPAIVSDRVGCMPDLVTRGVTGEVFPFGDVAALAACMSRLAQEGRLAEMGGAACRRVMRDYSVERSARAVVAATRSIVGAA